MSSKAGLAILNYARCYMLKKKNEILARNIQVLHEHVWSVITLQVTPMFTLQLMAFRDTMSTA